MTGSTAAVILIPIVATISVAAWLIVVFYADSHPQWRNGPSPQGSNPAPAALAQTTAAELVTPDSDLVHTDARQPGARLDAGG